MPRTKHILPLFAFISQIFAEDLTKVVPTLTSFGSLAPFTPPADCFSRSVWTTNRFFDTFNSAGAPQTRFFTRWYIGCNIDPDTSDYNTCCPPRYNTWGFYAPGVCPQGYSTVPNNAANPWVGDQRGTVCCPSIKSPAGKTLGGANFVTSFIDPLDRDPISISCFEWDDDVTKSGTIFQGNYNARAIIVFESELTSVGFQFAQLPGGTTPTRRATPSSSSSLVESTSEPDPRTSTSLEDSSSSSSSPSPGSTTSSGARQTETGSETSSSSQSTTSGAPTSTSQSNNNGGGGSKGLSGGAIAGIAIGVAIPVIAAIAFVAYRLGRGRQDVPIVPIHNDPSTKEMGYGGVQNQNQWR